MQRHVALVALEFGIRGFAENDDGNVSLLRRSAVGAEQRLSAGWVDFGLQALIDRGGTRKVVRAVIGALPGKRPAACLHSDIVGAVARDQHCGVSLDWQDAVILEQYQRFAHRLARDGTMTWC